MSTATRREEAARRKAEVDAKKREKQRQASHPDLLSVVKAEMDKIRVRGLRKKKRPDDDERLFELQKKLLDLTTGAGVDGPSGGPRL